MSGLMKKNLVRTFALAGCLVFTGTMFVGCGKKEEDDTTTAAPKKDSMKKKPDPSDPDAK